LASGAGSTSEKEVGGEMLALAAFCTHIPRVYPLLCRVTGFSYLIGDLVCDQPLAPVCSFSLAGQLIPPQIQAIHQRPSLDNTRLRGRDTKKSLSCLHGRHSQPNLLLIDSERELRHSAELMALRS
jgi:hypothetical protein